MVVTVVGIGGAVPGVGVEGVDDWRGGMGECRRGFSRAVVFGDLLPQARDGFRRDGRPPSGSGLLSPEPREALPMPAHEGLRPDDDQSVPPVEEAGEDCRKAKGRGGGFSRCFPGVVESELVGDEEVTGLCSGLGPGGRDEDENEGQDDPEAVVNEIDESEGELWGRHDGGRGEQIVAP